MYVWSFLYEIPKHKDSSNLHFKKPNTKKSFWLAEEKQGLAFKTKSYFFPAAFNRF